MMAKLSVTAARKLGLTVPGKATSKKKRPAAPTKQVKSKSVHIQDYSIRFDIPFRAVPKERARTVSLGNITFTPKRTEAFSAAVKKLVRIKMRGYHPFGKQIEVHLLFAFSVPKSWPKYKREAALAGHIRPTARPDLDNIEKSIFDAMNEIAYKDDAIIVNKNAAKFYADTDYIKVRVGPALSNEWFFR